MQSTKLLVILNAEPHPSSGSNIYFRNAFWLYSLRNNLAPKILVLMQPKLRLGLKLNFGMWTGKNWRDQSFQLKRHTANLPILSKHYTTSWQLTKTKISFAVKTIDLGSNLKVCAGIKKKNYSKKFFKSGEKNFRTSKISQIRVKFFCMDEKLFWNKFSQ